MLTKKTTESGLKTSLSPIRPNFPTFRGAQTALFFVTFLGLGGLGLSSCKENAQPKSPEKAPALRPKKISDDPSQAEAALIQSFTQRLKKGWLPKAFKLQGKSVLEMSFPPSKKTSSPPANTKLVDEILVEQDPLGTLHALLNNSREYGWEVYWKDGWIYYHNRYMPLQKQRGDRKEALDRVENAWSLLPAYWRLLHRHAVLTPKGAQGDDSQGENAWVYAIQLRPNPLPATQPLRPHEKWRNTVKVEALQGEIRFHKKSALPIQVTIHAKYGFHTPQGVRVQTKLHYSHTVQIHDSSKRIAIPEAQMAPVRRRDVLDRRALLGRLPRPGWYRGGGPVRDWRRRRRAARRTSRRGPTRRRRRARHRRRARQARKTRPARPTRPTRPRP